MTDMTAGENPSRWSAGENPSRWSVDRSSMVADGRLVIPPGPAPYGPPTRGGEHDVDVLDLEGRLRALIARLEAGADVVVGSATPEDHWFNCGKDEAYDNVLDWIYRDVLLEER